LLGVFSFFPLRVLLHDLVDQAEVPGTFTTSGTLVGSLPLALPRRPLVDLSLSIRSAPFAFACRARRCGLPPTATTVMLPGYDDPVLLAIFP